MLLNSTQGKLFSLDPAVKTSLFYRSSKFADSITKGYQWPNIFHQHHIGVRPGLFCKEICHVLNFVIFFFLFVLNSMRKPEEGA